MKGLSLRNLHLFITSLLVFTNKYKVQSFEEDYEISVALQEFKGLVNDLLYQDFMKTDEYLLRWLRVSNFDVYEAYEKLHKSLQWRKENDIDNIILEDFSSYVDKYPYTSKGFDKSGHPVSWMPFGSFDLRKITLAGKQKEFSRYFTFGIEMGEQYLYELQQNRTISNSNNNKFFPGESRVDGIFVVIDLNRLSLTRTACLECLKFLATICSNYEMNYPGIFSKIVLINAPNVVDIVVKVSTSVMSMESIRRVSVYDYDKDKWKKALLEDIPDTDMPIEYGGKMLSLFNKPFEVRNKHQANIIAKAKLQQRLEQEKVVDTADIELHSQITFNNAATTNSTSNCYPSDECNNSVENKVPEESININKKMDNNDNPNSLHHHHHHFKKVTSKQIEEEGIPNARESIRWPTTVISRASTFATTQSIFGIILALYVL